jgi:hypothetical protein
MSFYNSHEKFQFHYTLFKNLMEKSLRRWWLDHNVATHITLSGKFCHKYLWMDYLWKDGRLEKQNLPFNLLRQNITVRHRTVFERSLFIIKYIYIYIYIYIYMGLSFLPLFQSLSSEEWLHWNVGRQTDR